MNRITSSIFLWIFCMLLSNPSYAGPQWELGEDSWMKLRFLGQAHFMHQDNAPAEIDFYLRRGRLILDGQIMDGVRFFVETDNAKAGKYGVNASTEIQDAFIDVRIADSAHWAKFGLIHLRSALFHERAQRPGRCRVPNGG